MYKQRYKNIIVPILPFNFFLLSHSLHLQEDNGVKLVDPMGEMVTPAWEGYATQLANAEQEDLLTALKDVIEKEDINMSQEANVFVGKDTRYMTISDV